MKKEDLGEIQEAIQKLEKIREEQNALEEEFSRAELARIWSRREKLQGKSGATSQELKKLLLKLHGLQERRAEIIAITQGGGAEETLAELKNAVDAMAGAGSEEEFEEIKARAIEKAVEFMKRNRRESKLGSSCEEIDLSLWAKAEELEEALGIK